MHLTIISGSQRKDANSLKVAHIIDDMVSQQRRFVTTSLIDLATHPLPLFDPAHPHQGSWEQLAGDLQKSAALVVISPEWHGMVPSGLKNFFLYCTQKEIGHKPALIVTVSSGMGGSYPVTELRISSYKNNRVLYLPEHVILRQVGNFIQGYPDGESEVQRNLQGRLTYLLSLLCEYAVALNQVRASEVFDASLFASGM